MALKDTAKKEELILQHFIQIYILVKYWSSDAHCDVMYTGSIM